MTQNIRLVRRTATLVAMASTLLNTLVASGIWLSWFYMAGSSEPTVFAALGVVAIMPMAQLFVLGRAVERDQLEPSKATKLYFLVAALIIPPLVVPLLA